MSTRNQPSLEELIRLMGNRRQSVDAQVEANRNQSKADAMFDAGQGSGGGGDPWGGVGKLGTSDPMAVLMERIGKLRGAMEFNQGSAMRGNAGRMNADMRAQLGPLEELMARYQSREDLERRKLEEEIRQMRESGKSARRSEAASRAQMRSMSRNMPEMRTIDPYAEARAASIAAGKKYTDIEAPHLVSSLKLR